MKRTAYIILLLVLSIQSKATNQIEDILYYGQDKLHLYESPLEQIDNISLKIDNLKKNLSYSSDCHRSFYAEWTIINNELFLQNVYECNSNIKLNSTIEQILGCKFKNGLMKANWVNGELWAGKDPVPEESLYITIFKHEYKFKFNNGYLNCENKFDYTPCKYDNEYNLNEFILKNIDKNIINEINKTGIELSASVTSNNSGIIANITIDSSSKTIYNDEFIRVLKKLPCVKTYFYKGNFYCSTQSIVIKIYKEELDIYEE